MKKHLVFTLLLLATHCLYTNAQEPILKSDLRIESILVPKIGKEYSPLDPLMEQSVKAYMMPPRRQVKGRASAFYAVAMMVEYYLNVNNDYKQNLSPDYIFLNLKQSNITDTLVQSLNFAQQKGIVSAAIVPYGATQLDEAINVTKKFKIKSFVQLYRPTTTEPQRLYEIRKALTRGNPVLIEMSVTRSFLELTQNDRLWESKVGDTTPAGKIALVIVGFDERKLAFEVMNCAGVGWANRGYIWVKYTDLGKLSTDGFVIIPE